LIAPNVENSGVITAPNGEIYLAAGASVELVNSNDPNLRVNITAPAGDATNVGQLVASAGNLGLFGTVVRNSGSVSADSATMQGGRIVFRASQSVEAGGVISASGAGGGEIRMLADMQNGTINVSGTLDASAPVSGDGGYIDTSAAHVQIADTARITTAAENGNSGTWLIDPTDFYVSAADPLNGSSWMSNTTLSSSLAAGSVTIQTLATGTGNGDIFVNDAVNWGSASTLTLNAHRNVVINASITSGGLQAPGNLTARADLTGTGIGTVIFGASGYVSLQGGFTAVFYGSTNLYYNPVSYTSPTDYSAYVNPMAPLSAAMLVNDVNQLQAMNSNLAGTYALGRDIDATATATWNAGAGFQPIGNISTPFTGSLSGYAGSYTGSSYVINGLTINTPLANNAGLFGNIGSTGKVVMVNLANATVIGNSNVGGIAGMNAGNIFGGMVGNSSIIGGAGTTDGHVGGLVGSNSGSITSSFVSGGSVSGYDNIGGLVGSHMTGGVINTSHASGVMVSGHSGIGGLVGYSVAGITNSYVEAGAVTATLVAGGLVGNNVVNGGSISSSYVTGTNVALTVTGAVGTAYVGGLVGSNGGAIATSYVTGGSVDGNATSCLAGLGQCVGGLVGFNGGSIASSYATPIVKNGMSLYWGLVGFDVNGGLNVTNSFWDTQTTTAGISFGVGNATTSQLFSNNVHGLTTVSTMTSGSVSANGFDIVNTWYLIGGSTRPFLRSEWDTTITNSHQLQLMAMNLGASYTLGANIDMAETATGTGMWSAAGFVPLGDVTVNFTGNFDGQNHTISNIRINNPGSDVGLFGVIGSVGAVKNTGLIGSQVVGRSGVGGLVGNNAGFISNSYVSNGVVNVTGATGLSAGGLVGTNSGTISNSYVSGGSVRGTYLGVGGLVGSNTGTVDSSYASGVSVVNAASFATGVGGLIGDNAGTISNSYVNSGSVIASLAAGWVGGLVGTNLTGGSITNSYASNASLSSAGGPIGGVVGSNSGAVSSSFWNTGTVGTLLTAAGSNTGTLTNVVGLTTAQMMSMSSFTGWNIANTGGAGMVWRIYEGSTMPLLTIFLKQLTISSDGQNATYAGSAYTGGLLNPVYTVDGVKPVISDSLHILGSAYANAVNAGTYGPAHYSDQLGYDITFVNGTLTINPYAVSMTGSRIYDGTTNVVAGIFTFGPLVGTETLTLSGTGSAASPDAGTQTVAPGTLALGNGTGLASNYTFVGGTQTVTITPAALTVTAGNVSKTYGDIPSYLGTEFTSAGLVNGETIGSVTLTSSGDAVSANVAGSPYALTASAATGGSFNAANYSITYVDGQLTVTPAMLTVVADNQNKVFTTADPLLSYTVYGLKVTDTAATTLTGELVRVAGETVGTYRIDQGTVTVINPNYSVSYTYVPGVFTILAPTVINEIVDISVQDTTSSDEKKRNTSEALLLVDAGSASADPAVQALPVCQ
ncbi:MAG TPA: MBG domain-containing protein, partial [Gallionella sp.]